MHKALLVCIPVTSILALGSALLYAPFAKTWKRALMVPFIIAVIGTIFEGINVFVFEYNGTPAMGIGGGPFVYVFFSAIARGIKIAVFRASALQELEKKSESKG